MTRPGRHLGDIKRNHDKKAQRRDMHDNQIRHTQGACKQAEGLQRKGGRDAPERRPHNDALLDTEFLEAIFDQVLFLYTNSFYLLFLTFFLLIFMHQLIRCHAPPCRFTEFFSSEFYAPTIHTQH